VQWLSELFFWSCYFGSIYTQEINWITFSLRDTARKIRHGGCYEVVVWTSYIFVFTRIILRKKEHFYCRKRVLFALAFRGCCAFNDDVFLPHRNQPKHRPTWFQLFVPDVLYCYSLLFRLFQVIWRMVHLHVAFLYMTQKLYIAQNGNEGDFNYWIWCSSIAQSQHIDTHLT
jgi:hypothetical protein